MAFNNKNFSVMAYANGFTLWNYQTEDTLAAVKADNYFNDIAAFARPGDMIIIIADNASTLAPAIMFVTANADGVVTVSELNAVAKA